jgi:transcriptional regulator with XRE-family HTH domain
MHVKGEAGIGRRVRASRARLGLTREELAVRSGLSWSAIAQVESGRRASPRPATLAALARALGVSIDYLVQGGPVTAPMLNHAALIYSSDEAFAAATCGFVREGIERSEPVLAVTTDRNGALLRRRLRSDSGGVRLESARDRLTSPEAAVGFFRDYIESHLDDGADWIRIVGEPLWQSRTDEEVRRWTRFESLVNLAFATTPASFLCTYDERKLPAAVVEQARHTHPRVAAAGAVAESGAYRDPLELGIGG